MTNSITIEGIARDLSERFYDELLRTEDFFTFEHIVVTDMRVLAANVLRLCIERFDQDIKQNLPQGWSIHERAKRTLITLVGEVTYTRTIFLDEFRRRRALADELLGIPPRSRMSACAFIWVARCASELSYRKCAHEFFELSSVSISHVTVHNIVLKEGQMLKQSGAEFIQNKAGRISQDELFLETDGLWVHLQESTHRENALPRFLYEQARKTKSFELKIAALYAGKTKVAPGRYKRGGLCLTCMDGDADIFWERIWQMLQENYEEEDVSRIAVGSDGAKWCMPDRLEEKVSKDCAIDYTLDLFHIMQKVAKAFPDENSKERQWADNLIMRGKGKRLLEMCKHLANKMTPGSARKKVVDLKNYIANHVRAIHAPTHELGTIEGTNAHVGAARIKGQGRSWSRAGAEAMCLIRCALMTGRDLIAPSVSSWFSEKEIAIKEARLPHSASQIPQTTGHGWEPPQKPKVLTKNVAIPLYYRSKKA